MIIGAQKSGTTSLAHQLSALPEVNFCSVKEPGFFNSTANWSDELSRYHSLFSVPAGRLSGEGSTMHTFLPQYPQTAERIHAYNPQMKLMYIMRDPVERAISHFAHRTGHGRTRDAIGDVLFRNPIYIDRSRYAVQLRPYLELFPREQILLLIFEEYISNQRQALEQVSGFLGISKPAGPDWEDGLHGNPSVGEYRWGDSAQKIRRSGMGRAVRRVLPASLRRMMRTSLGHRLESKPALNYDQKLLLWRFLEDDVAAVESLLGRRLDIWRANYSTRAV